MPQDPGQQESTFWRDALAATAGIALVASLLPERAGTDAAHLAELLAPAELAATGELVEEAEARRHDSVFWGHVYEQARERSGAVGENDVTLPPLPSPAPEPEALEPEDVGVPLVGLAASDDLPAPLPEGSSFAERELQVPVDGLVSASETSEAPVPLLEWQAEPRPEDARLPVPPEPEAAPVPEAARPLEPEAVSSEPESVPTDPVEMPLAASDDLPAPLPEGSSFAERELRLPLRGLAAASEAFEIPVPLLEWQAEPRPEDARILALPQRAVPPLADTGGATVESGADESEPAQAHANEQASGEEPSGDETTDEPAEEETAKERPDIADQLQDAADTVVELVKGDDSVVQHGIDVSGWQGRVDWQRWWDEGKRFAYIKATEGDDFTNSDFGHQYNGAREVGMIRGAYHYALPNESSGAAQANYFVDNGGAWSADGQTLPGVLDIEFNPYGPTCFGMTKSAMVTWIEDFHDTYHERTGRHPVFYTNTKWWQRCVGTRHEFGDTVPLWIARYADDVGELPPGWGEHMIWQYTDSPLDKNEFDGSYRELVELARGDLLE